VHKIAFERPKSFFLPLIGCIIQFSAQRAKNFGKFCLWLDFMVLI